MVVLCEDFLKNFSTLCFHMYCQVPAIIVVKKVISLGTARSLRNSVVSSRDMKCYNCDGEGHQSRDCPEERKRSGRDFSYLIPCLIRIAY